MPENALDRVPTIKGFMARLETEVEASGFKATLEHMQLGTVANEHLDAEPALH